MVCTHRLLSLLILSQGSLAVAIRSSQTKAVLSVLTPEAKKTFPTFKQSGFGADSLYAAPRGLSVGPAWSWHNPKGRAYTLTFGITIDSESCLYLTSHDGVRKFTPDGQILWEKKPVEGSMYNTASLEDGKVYGQDLHGHVFALNMSTGETVWQTKVSAEMGQNNGFTNVKHGVVVIDSHAQGGASGAVSGINATDGAVLWTYKTLHLVWNFGASFPGDGSVTFQDRSGIAYRLRVNDGQELWKSEDHGETFTDGTAAIDSDGNVYTVENTLDMTKGPLWGENTEGKLTKRSLTDGHVMWQVTTPHPPNNQPVIGHGLVIQPMGSQQQQGAYTYVYAYDQETGKLRWVFNGPAQKGRLQAGDEEFMGIRQSNGLPDVCWPNPWSAPGFAQDGTVYVGNQEGGFYSLRDVNGDGVVSGPEEVSVYETLAAFPGSSSPAIAPGLLAIASCDTMFVFKS